MLCTNCQKPIRPVVALDIDGTLGDYHGHFLAFAEDYIGKTLSYDYKGDVPFKSWFTTINNVPSSVWHDVKLAYRQGGMKRCMPVYGGAAELATTIKDEGAELWLTTTRPYIRHDNVDPDTREWLRRNEIEYDYLIYDGAKYEKLKSLVGADRVCAVLDDLRYEIDEALEWFDSQAPILRHNSYNSSTNYPVTVFSLWDAGPAILDRVVEWKERYADSGHERTNDDYLRASE